MTAKELLSAQTIPCTRLQSQKCLAPQIVAKDVKNNSLAKMAGNSMSIPCMGIVMLAAACSLEPRYR